MKETFFKKLNARLVAVCLALASTAIIIHSCKKNDAIFAQSDQVALAKAWYESTYPNPGPSRSLSVTSGFGASSAALNSIIKPDWKSAANYNRFNKGVVEMPLDSAAKLGFTFNANNNFAFSKNPSKSSFLILNDGKTYTAYVLTIIGDSSYLQNDLTKLNRTTYRKRDDNFSGYVLYSTPEGKLVKGWHYLNGTINRYISPGSAQITNQQVLQSKSLQNSKFHQINNDLDGCSVNIVFVYLGSGIINLGENVVSTTYFYEEDIIIDCPPQLSVLGPPTIDGSGGLPDPTPPPDMITVQPVDSMHLNFCSNLTTTEQNNIRATLAAFSTEDCPSNFLYNTFKNDSFTFCIDSNSTIIPDGFNAYYSPGTKSFIFRNDAMANPANASLLEHEFFHPYQETEYTNFSSYGFGNPGFVNIEFEQIVFNDIATGTYSALVKGSPDQLIAYANWLDGLTANHTIYPKLVPNTAAYNDFITQYNSFLSQFNAIPDNKKKYSSTAISLIPQALIDIFNSVDKNCKL